MTQPDIYTVEARRRIAQQFEDEGMSVNADDIRTGNWREREVSILADALRELNWQPPVDPDDMAAWEIYAGTTGSGAVSFGARHELVLYRMTLAAYRAGKAARGDA